MDWKKTLSLVLALGVLLGCLAGCADEEEYEPEEPGVVLENTGEAASLTVAYSGLSDRYVEALEEIIEKYRADFPETEITLAPCGTEEEALGMLRSGEADLVQVEGKEEAALVEEGALWNFFPYMKAWREEPDLNNCMRQALYAMGDEKAYVMPADLRQEVLFYRADWVDAYNDKEENEEDQIHCKTWGQLCTLQERLGEQGKLAFGGKDRLGRYFDAILWSRASRTPMLRPCAAYFMQDKDENITTLFATEAGTDAALRFQIVMEDVALPQCFDWTVEQAVEAFKNGEAGLLFAPSSYQEELREALPKGALGLETFTRTDNNLCVTELDFWGWGISAKSGEKEVAVHFLATLSGKDNSTHLSKAAGTLPLHREGLMMEPSLTEGTRKAEMRMLQLGTEYQYASRPSMYVEASRQFAALYEKALREYLGGESTGEELLEELDAFWMEAYDSQPNTWLVEKEEDEEESA